MGGTKAVREELEDSSRRGEMNRRCEEAHRDVLVRRAGQKEIFPQIGWKQRG